MSHPLSIVNLKIVVSVKLEAEQEAWASGERHHTVSTQSDLAVLESAVANLDVNLEEVASGLTAEQCNTLSTMAWAHRLATYAPLSAIKKANRPGKTITTTHSTNLAANEVTALKARLNYDDRESQHDDNLSNGHMAEFRRHFPNWSNQKIGDIFSDLTKKGMGKLDDEDAIFWLDTEDVDTIYDAMAVVRKTDSMVVVRKTDGTVQQMLLPQLNTA